MKHKMCMYINCSLSTWFRLANVYNKERTVIDSPETIQMVIDKGKLFNPVCMYTTYSCIQLYTSSCILCSLPLGDLKL